MTTISVPVEFVNVNALITQINAELYMLDSNVEQASDKDKANIISMLLLVNSMIGDVNEKLINSFSNN